MVTLASKGKTLPAPAPIVWRSLLSPHAPGGRPWLVLTSSETEPEVVSSVPDREVVWSSLWPSYAGLRVVVSVVPEGPGCRLGWALVTSEAAPDDLDAADVQRLSSRLNRLFFADLRYSYGA